MVQSGHKTTYEVSVLEKKKNQTFSYQEPDPSTFRKLGTVEPNKQHELL